MSTIQKSGQVILFTIVFFLVLYLLASNNKYFEGLEPIHVFIALVPFIVALLVSGRLTEIRGPDGFSLKLRDAVREPVTPNLSDENIQFEVEPDEVIAKGSVTSLSDRISENPPDTLLLQLGRKNYYAQSAIKEYISV